VLNSHHRRIARVRLAGLEQTWDLWSKVANSDGRQSFHDVIAQAGTTQISDEVSRVPRITAGSGEDVGRSLIELDHFRSRMLGFMTDYDVLLCPVNANVAIKSGTLFEHFNGYSYTATHNLTGWPGVVVRAGTSDDGLPIGVQILARPYHEHLALAVAQFVETAFGGWQAPVL
jgi:amidase